MFFGKKKKTAKCRNCNSEISRNFNFCPFCGFSMADEEEMKDFGMLGKDDFVPEKIMPKNMGITDNLLNSIINSMMKNFDKQFREMASAPREFDGTEIQNLPNGIRIRIGTPLKKSIPKQPQDSLSKKEINDEQLKRMSALPRTAAKTKVRRLSDKIVYEMDTTGVESTDDIFISKLESGYEIKAIGKKKVYVNTIPISHPLKGFLLQDKKLLVEFKIEK